MKKKAKRYAEGGEPKFDKGTYERAKEFLRQQGLSTETPSLDDRIARARARIEAVTQSATEPAPSRSTTRAISRPASASRPAPTTPALEADVAGEASDRREQERQAIEAGEASDRREQERQAIEAGEARARRDFVRDADISIPPAATRSMASSSTSTPRPTPTVSAPTRRQTDTAAARREAEYSDVVGVEDYEAGQAAKRMMREAEQARSPRVQSQLGIRQAQQMEEKGSIYSPDYGLSRAVREQRQAEQRAEREAEARGRESDTRERERQAQEERDRRLAAAKRRQAEREAEARGRESDTRERERQAQEERDRKRQRVSAAAPPVPAPGTRAFANAPERAQRRTERQNERNIADELKRIARQEMLERRITPIETALRRRDTRQTVNPAMMGSPGFKSGGTVSSASKRGDGIATKGKTRGKYL
jgi:hypothetical protein